VLGRHSPRFRQLAALSTITGAALTRAGWLAAGRTSARKPVAPPDTDL
jgi:hypothetical protein